MRLKLIAGDNKFYVSSLSLLFVGCMSSIPALLLSHPSRDLSFDVSCPSRVLSFSCLSSGMLSSDNILPSSENLLPGEYTGGLGSAVPGAVW